MPSVYCGSCLQIVWPAFDEGACPIVPTTVSPKDIFNATLSGPTTPEHHIFPFRSRPAQLSPDRSGQRATIGYIDNVEKSNPATSTRATNPRPQGTRRQSRPKSNKKQTDKVNEKRKRACFLCPHPDCAGKRSFARREHLARHVKAKHEEQSYRCWCQKAFNRKDNLIQHCRRVHR